MMHKPPRCCSAPTRSLEIACDEVGTRLVLAEKNARESIARRCAHLKGALNSSLCHSVIMAIYPSPIWFCCYVIVFRLVGTLARGNALSRAVASPFVVRGVLGASNGGGSGC